MPMAAPQRIQAFPPGMVLPEPEAPLPAPAAPMPHPRAAELAAVNARREALLSKLAALGTHSHRRAEMMGRLRELTRRQLRLEAELLRDRGRRP